MTSTHDLLGAAAIRINALDGTDAAELQITYSSRPLIDEQFQSSVFPMNAIRDSLVQAQGKLAQAIAKSDDIVARAYLLGTSNPLASGADLPSTASTAAPFIGNYGDVIDGEDETVLTKMPVAVVRNRLLATSLYLAPAYQFALTPTRILHTRTTVLMTGCVWDGDAQTTIYDNNEPFTLQDSLVEAVICGGLAMLMRDDEFVQQATQWANYFATTLAMFPPVHERSAGCLAMIYQDLLLSAINNATRGMLPEQSAAIDAIGLADTLFPVVSDSVCEAVAADEYRRSLLRRSKSVTLAAGVATLTDDVLTQYLADATLIDPATLTKHYAWRPYPDFIRRGDKRLGIFTAVGMQLQVVEPAANFTVPLVATGTRTLTVPCQVVKPALATDPIDAPESVISDLDEALSNALRGALIKAAGAAA